MPLTINHPYATGYRWELFDLLDGWDKARIIAGLRDRTLTWSIEFDQTGRTVYLFMTSAPRRLVATGYLQGMPNEGNEESRTR